MIFHDIPIILPQLYPWKPQCLTFPNGSKPPMFDDISEKSLQIHWFTSLWATHPSYIQAVSNNTKYTNYSMDWFKGKSTGNHGIYHQIQGFPVNFPLSQFYKLYNYWCKYIYIYVSIKTIRYFTWYIKQTLYVYVYINHI